MKEQDYATALRLQETIDRRKRKGARTVEAKGEFISVQDGIAAILEEKREVTVGDVTNLLKTRFGIATTTGNTSAQLSNMSKKGLVQRLEKVGVFWIWGPA